MSNSSVPVCVHGAISYPSYRAVSNPQLEKENAEVNNSLTITIASYHSIME